jgi:hypothetical protein
VTKLDEFVKLLKIRKMQKVKFFFLENEKFFFADKFSNSYMDTKKVKKLKHNFILFYYLFLSLSEKAMIDSRMNAEAMAQK